MAPVKVANERLSTLFGRFDYKHILAVPNDVFLPPNLYREFLRWPRGVVTGSMNGERYFPRFAEAHAVNTCTPMAVGLFRRWAYSALMEKDGYCLDPKFVHYASDCDFALRLAACGITGVQLDIQYFHQCSASWRLAPPDVAKALTDQADVDRATFERKWGFKVDDARYGECARDINFKG
jgi:GT2 family glycosyltransferase